MTVLQKTIIISSLLCCCAQQQKRELDSIAGSYSLYYLDEMDVIKIPKISRADGFYPPRIFDSSLFIYYSETTDSVVFFDVVDQVKRCYKLLPNNKYGGNVGFDKNSDSVYTFFYRNDHSVYVDSCVVSINIYTSKQQFDYPIMNDKLMTKYHISPDSLRINLDLLLTKSKIGQEGHLIVDDLTKNVFIGLLAGSTDIAYQDLRPNANCVLKIDQQTRESTILNITFSHVNPAFADSLPSNVLNNSYLFTPHLFESTDSSYLVSFRLAADFVDYDPGTGIVKTMSGFPFFLDADSAYFGGYSTNALDQIYLFSSFTGNKNADLVLRQIKIPFINKLGEYQSEPRYFIYSKKQGMKCIGVIDHKVEKSVCSVDSYGNVYVYDMAASKADPEFFHIKKCKIRYKGTGTAVYNEVMVAKSEELSKSIRQYLVHIDKGLLEYDTIAVLYTFATCTPCLLKLGTFLKTVNNKNQSVSPSILIASNPYMLDEFITEYELQDLSGLYFDTLDLFSQYRDHPNTLAYLVKTKHGYEFIKFGVSDLDSLFRFLNSKIPTLNGVCAPYKEY